MAGQATEQDGARGGAPAVTAQAETRGARASAGEPREGGSRDGQGSGAPAAVWVSSTYFAEGFPYGVVNGLAEVLFKELGASLQVIGLTSLFHLPWNLKFLWGPLLDRYATKRAWLIACELALTAALLALAVLAGVHGPLAWIAVCFVALAALSATHDVAIDGYYLEGLDERGQSAWVGLRAMAYRVAGLAIGGPLLILTGTSGWLVGLLVAAAVMGILAAFHAARLPRVERGGLPIAALLGQMRRSRVVWSVAAVALGLAGAALWPPAARLAGRVASSPLLAEVSAGGWAGIALLGALLVLLAGRSRMRRATPRDASAYRAAFADFLAQPRVGVLLAFVVLFRAGESALVKMRWPFLREGGMTLDEYGFANGTLGVAASFLATILGGRLIARDGLARWIWPFVLAQNVLNLLYAWLAVLGRPTELGLSLLTGVIALEQFGAGLGTAVLMVYLMRCCDPAHKAAHMAILTALMSVSFTLAGVASGFLAEALGFARYFVLTFLITIPSMALILFLPHLDRRDAA